MPRTDPLFHVERDGETGWFHIKLDGETTDLVVALSMTVDGTSPDLDEFSIGVLVGLLVGEGHFGGDGRQPQITLRMHVRHEKIFRWLERTFPQGKLYGPYKHGGRAYFQWMIRGSDLRDGIAPLLAERIGALDDYAAQRFFAMCERYRIPVSDPGTKSPS